MAAARCLLATYHESGMDEAGDINPSEDGAVRAQKCECSSIEGLCWTGLQNQK